MTWAREGVILILVSAAGRILSANHRPFHGGACCEDGLSRGSGALALQSRVGIFVQK